VSSIQENINIFAHPPKNNSATRGLCRCRPSLDNTSCMKCIRCCRTRPITVFCFLCKRLSEG